MTRAKRWAALLAVLEAVLADDGHFVLTGNRVYMVGGLNDPAGWNHMDNSGASARPVAGTWTSTWTWK